ncbi:MAG: NAD(P)/FAD-dependent oxidoreductase [Ginsengibacter sp.]
MKQTNTLIIGASISGLACASSLQKQNIDYLIIEKQNQVAAPWRNHYERLHLHTSKRFSNLPYKKFESSVPRYPSRQQVVDYLEDYQKEFGINPVYNTEAVSIKKEANYWITQTSNGTFKSKHVIMATGAYGKPKPIKFKGKETFTGKIIHSIEYKTGKEFSGQNVLVVGFGNSACEIAIDLYENGARPSMSVRSPVNVIPRDILGIPVLELSLLMKNISPRIADKISAPLMSWLVGDLKKLGLKKLPYGPLEEIQREGKIPLLDIGTIRHIRNGNIKIYDDIELIKEKAVFFKSGKKENFDAIVAAIGYDRNYDQIVKVGKERFKDLNVSVDKQKYFGKNGLYFCGYWISPTGQFREISLDAKKIAMNILKKEKHSTN